MVREAVPPMESRGQLRAKKVQKAVTDDALLSACIADQLMGLSDVPGEGKGVVCSKVRERGALSCEPNLSYDTSYLRWATTEEGTISQRRRTRPHSIQLVSSRASNRVAVQRARIFQTPRYARYLVFFERAK